MQQIQRMYLHYLEAIKSELCWICKKMVLYELVVCKPVLERAVMADSRRDVDTSKSLRQWWRSRNIIPLLV